MRKVIIVVMAIFTVAVFGTLIYRGIVFDQNCGVYLKRAADANTVETAKAELEKSIKYLEDNNLTSGYTSVLYRTPDEDIEFFYKNLKASYAELSKVDSTTTSLEKTNMLMKLRETLLDSGEKGQKLTCPDGISKYPLNGLFALLTIVAIIFIIVGIVALIIEFD